MSRSTVTHVLAANAEGHLHLFAQPIRKIAETGFGTLVPQRRFEELLVLHHHERQVRNPALDDDLHFARLLRAQKRRRRNRAG